MANISRIVQVAKAFVRCDIPSDTMLHVCVYHSRHPFIVRSAIEEYLDRILKRHKPEAVFEDVIIRERLANAHPEVQNHLFIVLGSPVTEVGRDHDYDWAIVEPSSMRSLIQLAGRVRRHRTETVQQPNIAILEHNVRFIENPKGVCYILPGFELEPKYILAKKNMSDIVEMDLLYHLDSRSRVALPNRALKSTEYLVDLEHTRLQDMSLPSFRTETRVPKNPRERKRAENQSPEKNLNASTWWDIPAHHSTLTYALQSYHPFRQGSQEMRLVLMADDDFSDWKLNEEITKNRKFGDELYAQIEHRLLRLDDEILSHPRIVNWLDISYLEALKNIAEYYSLDARQASLRYGFISVNIRDNDADKWAYHERLGFNTGT
jgi:CRISPR-associated endonuclease/helicase Cas3